jgi:hypothetical protein
VRLDHLLSKEQQAGRRLPRVWGWVVQVARSGCPFVVPAGVAG